MQIVEREDESMTGVISRIVVDRGFGFISPVGSAHSRQLFFHASGLVDG
ncbi:MAG: hypothetical protein FJ143_04605, partial [Deltaproteobacteria bacterium]|nr:hypothetical protein [Deltaproteobacteria bacterium]